MHHLPAPASRMAGARTGLLDPAHEPRRSDGPGFDDPGLAAPFDPESLTRTGGRGMILIRASVDEVRRDDGGDELRMVVRRKPTGKAACLPP